jgi:hypothetical protein
MNLYTAQDIESLDRWRKEGGKPLSHAMNYQEILKTKHIHSNREARAKLAYDAYTVAAGETSPVPFIALWPRQREGWIAAVQTLDDPLTEPHPYREETAK